MEDSETDVSDEYCTCTTLMMKRNTNWTKNNLEN
jgi:hypothetical protein